MKRLGVSSPLIQAGVGMLSGALAALTAMALGMIEASRSLVLVAVLGLISCCCR